MSDQTREKTFTMESYLKKIRTGDIREDQDVQRLSGQWKANHMNELIHTVLTGGYIPPLLMGEEDIEYGMNQLWLIDGVQRTSSLCLFRDNCYKISSAIRNSRITYQVKVLDKDKNPLKDENGDYIWESVECDISGKYFKDLPVELQEKFNEFQTKIVIFQHCTMLRISELVCIYNNHVAMNAAQTAFTYISNYAREIRLLTRQPNLHSFFKNCGFYKSSEYTNGTLDRIVMESVMTMFHINNWQKMAKKMGTYLNENSSKEEFSILKSNLDRLESVCKDQFKNLFTSKDSFIWIALFHRFTQLGIEDKRFADFLIEFQKNMTNIKFKEYEDKSFDSIDDGKGSKDKNLVITKMKMLESLMFDFFKVKNTFQIIKEKINAEVTSYDIEDYEIFFNSIINKISKSSKLVDKEMRPSFIALVAYAYHNDLDNFFEAWMKSFLQKKYKLCKDQIENYTKLETEFVSYINSQYKNCG